MQKSLPNNHMNDERQHLRILMHCINFSPELTGIGKYSGEMAEFLSSCGHEVRVITAPPYYPYWRIVEGFLNSWQKEQARTNTLPPTLEVNEVPNELATTNTKCGMVVYRCPLWVPAKPSGLKRLLHLASFALSSFPIMLSQVLWRPNVVIVMEPPLFCAPQAWLVARLSGGKAWLHIQDFEVDAAFDLGILRANWMKWWVLKFETIMMRRFDRVSTISPNMHRKLIEKGVDDSRTVLFPNWVEGEEIYPLPRPSSYRIELGVDEKVCVALYSGNMGEKQGLEVVVEAARRFSDNPDVLFVLCGDGAARGRLVAQARDLRNIRWLPLQPTERLNELLNLADIHLLPQRSGAADLVMPSKLLGMQASGRPILAMAGRDTQLAKEVQVCGAVVALGDEQGFYDVLLKWANHSEERALLGKLARVASAKWGKARVLNDVECALQEMCRG